jgi:hypothetical protein
MSTTTHSPTSHSIGERVELARYTIPSGPRVLYGQRVDGVVRITDTPAATGGRAYLVERELEQEGSGAHAALQALLADYIAQAQALDAIPMARSQLGAYLQQLGR